MVGEFKAFQREARDGTCLCDLGELPKYWGVQRYPSPKREKLQLVDKVRKVISRGYLEDGFVQSLTGYFSVPKGDDDIRVIYDATQCALKDRLWAPNFILPTVDSVLRSVDARC